MAKKFILFGKPGAGKGTRLSEFLKGADGQYDVLSVGNLLRKAREEQTELGQKASYYMDAGLLVPSDIVNAVVIEGLKNADKPIFLDGFPRTIAQAMAMLGAGIYPTVVIEFYVDDEVVLERSRDRIVCPHCGEPYTTSGFKPPKVEGICDKCGSTLLKRPDDAESVVLNRLDVYRKETYPLLDILARANVPIHTIDNSDAETAGKQFAELMASL